MKSYLTKRMQYSIAAAVIVIPVLLVILFIIASFHEAHQRDLEYQNSEQKTVETEQTPPKQVSETGETGTKPEQVKSAEEIIEQKKTSTQSEVRDIKTFDTIDTTINQYRMPEKSGNWRTCVAERINTFNNLQLIEFYEWLKNLSPYASELTSLVAISRELGCPDPSAKTIPAKTELVKSWGGIGSKTIESQPFVIPIDFDWELKLSWQNSPFNQGFGKDSEEIAFNKASWEYGLVNYPETATLTWTPIIVGFYLSSGEDGISKSLWGSEKFDLLRIKAPDQASWIVKLEKIVEPAKTIIE